MQRCARGDVEKLIQYVYNCGVIISQVFSVILGGDPDETVSSRSGKAARAGIWWFVYVQVPVINMLFRDQKHCQNAIEDDEGKKEIWHWVRKG